MTDEDLDFDLRIRPDPSGGSNFLAYVAGSPAGNAETVFQLPVRGIELENFLLKIGQPRRPVRRGAAPASAAQLAKDFGGALFKAVFAGDVAACLRSSEDLARASGRRLRVHLRLNAAPVLSDLPWEFLYDQQRNRFLALSQDTPVIRELDLSRSSVDPVPISPLRILAVISGPTGYDPLDTEREWTMLQSALADLRERGTVELHRLTAPTLDELRSELRRSSWHVLHFMGHGGFDADGGLLVFEDEEHRPVDVSAEELGITLYDHQTLRLVLLNACEGARCAVTDPFAGTAQQLLQQGIPAVVAMQFEITDNASIVLSHEFYRALADGLALDESLTEARKAVFAVSRVEWATPVLYLRGQGGRLFAAPDQPDGPAPALRPAEVLEASYARLGSTDAYAPPTTPARPTARSRARRILDGVQAATDPVRRTLGPLARPVVVQAADGSVEYTTDSARAAHSVSGESLEERIGAELIATLVDEVRTAVADGAATAVIVAAALIEGLTDLVDEGASPPALSRALDGQTTRALELLERVTSPLETLEWVAAVVTTATGNAQIGGLIAEALGRVGPKGVIVTEESQAVGLELRFTGGMRIDKGYLSPYFVTDEARGTAELADPYVLVVNAKIAALSDLVPLLEKVMATGRPLLVVADDVEGEALATLIVNKTRGALVSAAVQAPESGDRRATVLGDLAVLTGATVLSEAGPTLEAAELDVLGGARSVVVNAETTTLVDGAGYPYQLLVRLNQIQQDLEQSDSVQDREWLLARQSTFGGLIVISVGGPRPDQIPARRAGVDRALRLTRGALQRGIVLGGGKALLATARRLAESTDPAAGSADLLVNALRAPLRQLAVNAGMPDVEQVMAAVDDPDAMAVFDARAGEIVENADAILDSAEVVRTVVSSAAACARRFLSIL